MGGGLQHDKLPEVLHLPQAGARVATESAICTWESGKTDPQVEKTEEFNMEDEVRDSEPPEEDDDDNWISKEAKLTHEHPSKVGMYHPSVSECVVGL